MNRKLRVEDDNAGGFKVIDEADGAVVDWIAKPVTHATPPGPEVTYVTIEEKPEAWPEDMRWIVTTGQRVVQTGGLGEGRTGTIRGQARSRKANRIYARNLSAAASIPGRNLTDADFEILIDNEGPLIEWDDAPGQLDWFPGQAGGMLRPLDGSRCPCGPLSPAEMREQHGQTPPNDLQHRTASEMD